jgi:phosphotriesterase-related protein
MVTEPAQVSTAGSLGQIITVMGPLAPEDAGPTLLHEHVICDMRTLMRSSSDTAGASVTLVNAAEIRWDPYSSPDNYLLDDIETAADELGFFARGGGGTVVDCTPSRYRDPFALHEVARRSGVNIVMGGGHYLEKSHPPGLGDQSLERLAAEIVYEVRDGVGETGIRPGIIGEIGTGDPMTRAEERVLRAMAWAQVETGLALTVHVHPWGRGGHRVMDVLEGEGVSPDRVVLNHAFVDVDHPDYVAALLARGATLGYDMFGFDHALFRVGRYPPSDFEVATEVARLIEAGHAGQLILSQDVCVKTRLRAYGGWGYAHIIEHVVPVLRDLGVSAEDLDQILVRNPARLLAVC